MICLCGLIVCFVRMSTLTIKTSELVLARRRRDNRPMPLVNQPKINKQLDRQLTNIPFFALFIYEVLLLDKRLVCVHFIFNDSYSHTMRWLSNQLKVAISLDRGKTNLNLINYQNSELMHVRIGPRTKTQYSAASLYKQSQTEV